MINMVPYFDAYSYKLFFNLNETELVFVFTFIAILLMIFMAWNHVGAMEDVKADKYKKVFVRIVLSLSAVIIMSTMLYRLSPFGVRLKAVRDVREQIETKFDMSISAEQVKKLLKDQPGWANQLTKKELKDYLNRE